MDTIYKRLWKCKHTIVGKFVFKFSLCDTLFIADRMNKFQFLAFKYH